MRMKKLLILAVAAITLASCSNTFEVKHHEGSAIGFGTWSNVLTRAISDPRTAGTNSFGVGDSFAVYGYKSASDESGKATVFDDDEVEMTVAGTPGTWTYSPLRFWDTNYYKYTFFAISPSSVGTAATVDPQTGAVSTSGSISFNGKSVASDVLVADKKTVLKAAYNSQVELVFNHIAALVDFKVSKAPNLADATVKVTAFSLSNIENVGTFSVTSAYNGNAYSATGLNPIATWSTGDATGSYGPGDGVNSVSLEGGLPVVENDAFTNFDGTDNGEPAAAKATYVINNLVVKPQTFTAPANRATPEDAGNATAQKVTISYTITTTDANSNTSTNTYSSTLWLADFDIVNDIDQEDGKVASWDTGKHYVFYITLDSKPIVFGATVNPWTTGVGYHYLVN